MCFSFDNGVIEEKLLLLLGDEVGGSETKKRRCTNCKQEEARVCDRVRERYAHRVQTLGCFVVDVATHACDVVLAEVGVPVEVVYKLALGERLLQNNTGRSERV